MRFATHILIAATFIPLFASCGKRQSDDSQGQPDKLPTESDKFTGPWDIVFLDIATGDPTGNRIRQRNRIVDLSLSSDGKVLINSCRKAIPGQHKVDRKDTEKANQVREWLTTDILRVWNAETGELIAEREDKNTRHTVVMSIPGGQRFLTASMEFPPKFLGKHRFLLWEYSANKIQQVAEYKLPPRSNLSMAVQGQGKSIVVCGDMFDKAMTGEPFTRDDIKDSEVVWAVRRWDSGGGEPNATLQVGYGISKPRDPAEMVARAHISGNGSRMITHPPGSNRLATPQYTLWDLEAMQPVGEPRSLPTGQTPVGISHDGKRIIVVSRKKSGKGFLSSYRTLDVESGEEVGSGGSDLLAFQARFAGDSKSVLGLTYQRSPEQWFLQLFGESGRQVWRSGPYHSARFLVGIAPGHSRIAFAVFPDERKQPNNQDAK